MKKILLLTTTLFVSSLAFADAPAPAMRKSSGMPLHDYYAKIEAGVSIPNKTKATVTGTANGSGSFKYDANFVGGIGGGYRFNEFFRTDLMLQYTRSESKKLITAFDPDGTKIKTNTYNVMLNGYLDAHNDTIFTPYLLAGIGVGHNRTKLDTLKVSKTNFIWNLGAGVMAKMHDQVNVGLEYRYVDFGKLGSKTVDGANINLKKLDAHQLLLNLTYHV